jgi:hypothetical protein
VALVTNACTTTSHEQSLMGIRGYCRQRTADTPVTEIAGLTQSHAASGAIR